MNLWVYIWQEFLDYKSGHLLLKDAATQRYFKQKVSEQYNTCTKYKYFNEELMMPTFLQLLKYTRRNYNYIIIRISYRYLFLCEIITNMLFNHFNKGQIQFLNIFLELRLLRLQLYAVVA